MIVGLQLKKELAGDVLNMKLLGDLNVKTSPYLEEELTNSLAGVKELILDFAACRELITEFGKDEKISMDNVIKIGLLGASIPPSKKLFVSQVSSKSCTLKIERNFLPQSLRRFLFQVTKFFRRAILAAN